MTHGIVKMKETMIINPENVIENCLVTAFRLNDYLEITDAVHQPNFKATPEFRKKFNGFYIIRQRSKDWYDKYYDLLEQQRKNEKSFEALLEELYSERNSIEVSFISKLIAAVSPNKPIWDQYVIKKLRLYNEWEKARKLEKDERIKIAGEIYNKIQSWYDSFINSDDGKMCIEKFDDALPSYKDALTDTKKIDFMLWSMR